MDYVVLWFILSGGTGYLPPMDVRNPPCGIEGAIVGVVTDKPVNPTKVLWPDPYFPGTHCEIDIREKIATLAEGEYHLATTIMGRDVPFGTPIPPYIQHDPHTSTDWVRSLSGAMSPTKPTTFRVIKPVGDAQ